MKHLSPALRRLPFLRRSRLRTRLVAAFLLISVLPCLVLMLFSMRVYSRSIRQKLSSSAQQSMQLLDNNFTYCLEESSAYISSLSVTDTVQTCLTEKPSAAALRALFNYYSPLTARNNGRLLATVLLDREGSVVYNYGGMITISPDALFPVLEATDARSPASFVGIYHPTFGPDCIAMCRKIYGMNRPGEHIGYILLFLHADVFAQQIFPDASLGAGVNMFLMDNAGAVLLTQKDAIPLDPDQAVMLLDRIHSSEKSDRNDYFTLPGGDTVLYSYNDTYQLYLVSLLSKDDLEREIVRVRQIIVLFSVILMAVCYVLSTLIYRSVSDPIGRIVSACGQSGDTPYQPIADTAPDELGYLARAIDAMAEKNETMLQDLQEKDMQKRDLELEMLQYQINPHFLFNTLNALKWIAAINGVESLSSGISSLAGVLRNTLEKKDELISIEEEISVLQDYCAIQNLRYTGQFHMDYRIDDDCLTFRIPRFLLQPLVENAILHGMRGNNTILNICVQCAFVDSFLQISIQDDGVGFDVADAMDPETGQFAGIGLSNVDKRLQLFYGETHRLVISSEKNVGTTCQINIPLEPDPSIT